MNDTSAAEPRLFISHHSSTYDIALEVEKHLARRGVSCWIAPRDVEPGEPFDKAISAAILGSAAILLLFCEKSDKSRHVKRELILADTAARPIIPLRLEAMAPGELAYHLADSQWIDWIDRREQVMDRVANQARQYASVAPAIDGALAHSHGLRAEDRHKFGPPSWAWIAGGVAGLLAIVAVTWSFATRGTGDDGMTEQVFVDVADERLSEGEEGSASEEAAESEPAKPTPSATPTVVPTTRPADLAPRPAVTPRPTVTATMAPQPVVTATITATPTPLQRVVSFCRGAGTDAEYLICAEPDLQTRAAQMGDLIRQIRESLADDPDAARAFNAEQRRWYDGVRASCHDAACITSRQTARNAALQAMVGN